MRRFFNDSGPCEPRKHYMLPVERRLHGIRELIDRELYFAVHAPRQTGKTTSYRALARELTAEGRYAAVHATCETAQAAGGDVARGVQAVLGAIEIETSRLPEPLRAEPLSALAEVEPENRLRVYLSRWAERAALPVGLFLDEIDAVLDQTLISVLRQLRAGYPDRPERFPHACALIGLRDVRDYRASLRPERDSMGSASPFNIKSDSLTLRYFTADEVAELYRQHTADTGQEFTDDAVAVAYDLTRGQPWLVNALARHLVDSLVTDRTQTITAADVDVAREVLIRRRDTHLDSLLDRLIEPPMRRVIAPILAGEPLGDEIFNDDVRLAKDLGLVASGPAGLEIANPIYKEIIPRALTALSEESLPIRRAPYIAGDGRLRYDALLGGAQEFWLEHAEWMLRCQPYSEAAAQLAFMAFLHRVVNGTRDELGKGPIPTIDREYAVGRGRIDLLIRWPLPSGEVERFALELKVWRDRAGDPLPSGLKQLSAYLARLGLDTGTLVLFDQRSDAPPLPERCSRAEVEHGGRTITVLRL